MDIRWLTDLTITELQRRAAELIKPYKKIDIDGIAICDNLNIENLEGEMFKKYPDTYLDSDKKSIEISNFGRVKLDKKIVPQYVPDDDENLYVDIPGIRTKRREKVYRLVAEIWCENPNIDFYNQDHHISNNWYDNRKENLLWVTETQHARIHPFMMNMIHGITVYLGNSICALFSMSRKNETPILYEEIKKLNKEIINTRIKCIGEWGKFHNEGNIGVGEYEIYVFDELKYSTVIPDNLLSIMKTGNILQFLQNAIKYKKKNIFEFYKDLIENGPLKNIVSYDKLNDEFDIDSTFDEKYENCKKEVASIIISSIKNMIKISLR
ncbi:hypothetical protein FACS189493_4310 [Spirochaetia bacterium]|nr:hypothetical protein FACS189493_4310 [Spirochaetia bacterium]